MVINAPLRLESAEPFTPRHPCSSRAPTASCCAAHPPLNLKPNCPLTCSSSPWRRTSRSDHTAARRRWCCWILHRQLAATELSVTAASCDQSRACTAEPAGWRVQQGSGVRGQGSGVRIHASPLLPLLQLPPLPGPMSSH